MSEKKVCDKCGGEVVFNSNPDGNKFFLCLKCGDISSADAYKNKDEKLTFISFDEIQFWDNVFGISLKTSGGDVLTAARISDKALEMRRFRCA